MPPQLFIFGVNCPIPVAPPSEGNMHFGFVPVSTRTNILLQLSYTLRSTMSDFSFQVDKNGEDFASNGNPFAKTLLSYFRRRQPLIHALHVTNHPLRVANHLWSLWVSPSEAKPSSSLGFPESLMLGQRPEKIRG